MMKMFAGMGLNGQGGEEGFMPMMQGMMKTLLSKEVLYPSLKEINDKVKYRMTNEPHHEKSKKISNDQELIQSDPISCPQNQKGNN